MKLRISSPQCSRRSDVRASLGLRNSGRQEVNCSQVSRREMRREMSSEERKRMKEDHKEEEDEEAGLKEE